VLLADLARADVQAFLAYRLLETPGVYTPAWGRSYLGDASILVPSRLWPDRPPPKVRYGTDALYGDGSYVTGQQVASRVYGISGEAMLNVGVAGGVAAYAVLGLLVRLVRAFGARLTRGDPRLLLYPLLVCLCCVTLVGDLDNVLFFLVKFGLVPFAVVGLSSMRERA
jgi:hypothetical protein